MRKPSCISGGIRDYGTGRAPVYVVQPSLPSPPVNAGSAWVRASRELPVFPEDRAEVALLTPAFREGVVDELERSVQEGWGMTAMMRTIQRATIAAYGDGFYGGDRARDAVVTVVLQELAEREASRETSSGRAEANPVAGGNGETRAWIRRILTTNYAFENARGPVNQLQRSRSKNVEADITSPAFRQSAADAVIRATQEGGDIQAVMRALQERAETVSGSSMVGASSVREAVAMLVVQEIVRRRVEQRGARSVIGEVDAEARGQIHRIVTTSHAFDGVEKPDRRDPEPS